MPIKVGINGFGRIGRNIMRTALGDKDIEFVAVNDLTDAAHARPPAQVRLDARQPARTRSTHTDDSHRRRRQEFKVFKTKDPAEIAWASVGADIVVESTGLFTKGADAKKHLRAPVKKVIISAPANGPDVTVRARRQRQHVRSGQAPHHFQRLVHDELPRAGRQGHSGHVRHQEAAR